MVRRVCARVHMRGREGGRGREGERKELGYTPKQAYVWAQA